MGEINAGGVVKGGLAAAVIMNISELILNAPVAGAQIEAELAAHTLGPVGGTQIAVFVALTTMLGFATVWLYAAIRPRLGPGPMTALCAGLVVWTLSYLYMMVTLAVLGLHSMGVVVLTVAWTAVEMIVASAVGGYLYNES